MVHVLHLNQVEVEVEAVAWFDFRDRFHVGGAKTLLLDV